MTIKRRLFISNILMLIIPILLSFILTSGMMLVYIQINESDDNNSGNKDLFYNSVHTVDSLIDDWSKDIDLQKMKADIDNFNELNKDKDMSICIYQEGKLIYPTSPNINNPYIDIVLSNNEAHEFIIDKVATYRKNLDHYSIILTCSDFGRRNDIDDNYILEIGIVSFFFMMMVIFFTNRCLTTLVFKSITTPLDILANGVHQIRDGNLVYHIEYDGKDEFAEICSDFNEMAQRLLDSVNSRQKDEANRKELIAGISHDIRTPLTSIKAYVEGIEKGVASTPEAQKRYLDTIKNKTNDLEQIVNKLFLFSKLDIGEFPFHLEEINIGNEMCNLITAISEEYEKKGVLISLVKNVQNIYVRSDVVQLRSAVINVFENSVKYKNKEKGLLKVSCWDEENHVMIKLEDDGPGVTSEALDKLFDIFYRADPSRSNPSKGSGLGLAITAKIIERLEGSISAENVVEGGLAIVIMLPKQTRGGNVEKDIDN